jgi:hypothetical protein
MALGEHPSGWRWLVITEGGIWATLCRSRDPEYDEVQVVVDLFREQGIAGWLVLASDSPYAGAPSVVEAMAIGEPRVSFSAAVEALGERLAG